MIYNNLGDAEKFNVPIPKGVLIIGMPGCGKSMIAQATANLFGVSLLRLDVSRLMGKYVGESEANLRLALATAEAAHPCVLWIDEIEKAGIYIDTIKGPYGGYVLNQNISVPKRFITPKNINIKDKNLYNLINRSIKEKRKCLIEYYSKNTDKVSKRIIHPYDLILLGSEWGIAAYCELKDEIRHFYLNRIKSIEILENFYN